MEPTVTPSPQRPGYWRAATIFCLLLLVLGTTAGVSMFEQFSAQVRDLQQRVQKTAQLRYVAVLLDDKNQAAMLLTQQTGDSFLQLQRLNAVVEGGEDSMQLWLVPASGPALSLGVLTAKLKTLRLEISEQLLSDGARLAISVENKGGVSERQGPRLPYLLTGTLIRKAL